MAWVDDRIYAHPKVLRVSKPARWIFVASIAYSSGWGTRGFLEPSALEAIGCEPKLRAELVKAGLWDVDEDGYRIHDWDQHNGKSDAKKARDRERKRAAYWSKYGKPPPDSEGTNGRSLRWRKRGENGGERAGETDGDARASRGLTDDRMTDDGEHAVQGSSSTSPRGLSVARPPASQASGEEVGRAIDASLADSDIDRELGTGGAR